MSARATRILPHHANSDELRAFQARVVKLRARALQHDLSVSQLKERVTEARQKLASTLERKQPHD